jgi:dihydrofolate reductase
MDLSIIVAVADNDVIGRDNRLPWRLSADLKRFKALTMDHHLLLGRKTWESIGRPLPGRRMIVVTGSDLDCPETVYSAASVGEGIERARSYGETELFVAGGASIYAATLPLCDRLYLTRVHAQIEGNVSLPAIDFSEWNERSREDLPADDDNDHPTSYFVYERSRAS